MTDVKTQDSFYMGHRELRDALDAARADVHTVTHAAIDSMRAVSDEWEKERDALRAESERLQSALAEARAEHALWRDHFDGKHGADLSHPLCHHCLSVHALAERDAALAANGTMRTALKDGAALCCEAMVGRDPLGKAARALKMVAERFESMLAQPARSMAADEVAVSRVALERALMFANAASVDRAALRSLVEIVRGIAALSPPAPSEPDCATCGGERVQRNALDFTVGPCPDCAPSAKESGGET